MQNTIIKRVVAVSLAAWVAVGSVAPAQSRVGDVVIGGVDPVLIETDGTYSTLASLPAPNRMTTFSYEPASGGFLAALNPFPGKPAVTEWTPSGTIGPVWVQSWTVPTVWDMFPDPYGKTVLVGTTNYGQTGFGDLEPGAFTLSYEAAENHPSNAAPLRACLDPLTDQVLCITATGALLHIEREDPIAITTLASSSRFAYPGGVHAHPRADKLIVEGVDGDFFVVDRASGAKTTLYDAPGHVDAVVGWDVDPERNAIVAYRHEGLTERTLVRIDIASGALTTVWASTSIKPDDARIAVFGGDLLSHAGGTPTPGTNYDLRIRAPGYGGADYILAASRGAIPGFPLQGRHIPLNLDDVLIDSLTNPTIYQGFIGVLDANGTAPASFKTPQHLAGQRIQFAVVILQQGFVKAVSLPFGITVGSGSN